MDLFDGQTIFVIAFTLVAVAVALGAVVFVLWYKGDQQEI